MKSSALYTFLAAAVLAVGMVGTLASCNNKPENPPKKVTVNQLLGDYTATGTPQLFTEPTDKTSWKGKILDSWELAEAMTEEGKEPIPPQELPFDWVALTQPFGLNEVPVENYLPIAIIDGKLYLNDYYPIYAGKSQGRDVLIFACAAYDKAYTPENPMNFSDFLIGKMMNNDKFRADTAIELAWDPENRTITFPATYHVDGTPLCYGIYAFEGDEYGIERPLGPMMSAYYKDVVIKLK